MIIERFSQNVIDSGIFRLYIATGFFSTLIFFIINADLYTPIEMILGIMGVTIVLKGLANIMLSLVISLFSFESKKAELEFKHNADKIESLMTDLTIQEASHN